MGIRKITYTLGTLIFCLLAFALQAQQVTVSLLLPFSISAQLADAQSTKAELGRLSKAYYQGFLIGLDSLSHPTKTIRLQVYDTDNDSLRTARILQLEDFKQSQLIIGPVMQGGNKMVSAFAAQKKIPQLSPLMTFSKTRINEPYWIAANPELPNYARIFCHYIRQTNDTAVVIVITDKSPYDQAITPVMKKLTGEYKKIKFQFVEFTPTLDIQHFISPTVPVHILMPGNKEQNCYRLLYQLKDTTEQPHVAVYGFSQWFDFKTVDIDLWQRKNVHFLTPAFIDYSNEQVKSFVTIYREKYATEPGEEAIKGYDQARYFTQVLLDKGSGYLQSLGQQSYTGLSTTYRYSLSATGVLFNNYLNVLRFENNKLVRVY